MKTTTNYSGSILSSERLSLFLLSLFVASLCMGSPLEGALAVETDPCDQVGDTRLSIENSPSIDAGYATVSQLGNDLLVSYYDYNDWSVYNKKIDSDGVVTDMVTPSVSPRANDGSETVIYHGLDNGNIVVIWYSSSSSKGLTDTYFKIVDEAGTEIAGATKINTLAGSLNRFTRAEQLSNGNIVFTWATGGSDYAMRRFTSAGAAVDANQISLTSLAGLTGTSQYAYNVAANDNGRFMVFIENYSSNYYGMIFENDASTPIQVGGQNAFVTGQVTTSGHGDKVTHISTLSTGQFLLVYQVQDGGGTATRSITYKVYNDDGSVAVNEVIRRQVYSWGYIGEPIITNDGFILTYTYNDLGYGPGLNSVPYLEYFNNSGTFTQDLSSCLPSFEGEYGEAQVFSDIDGSIGVLMNDTEGGFDYNIWLLRQSDVGGPSTSEPELTTVDASSLSISGATLNGEVVSDGGGTVSDRGFVYGTSPDPVIGDGRSTRVDVAIGSGVGEISQAIDGLSTSTTYYVKSFAINEYGTGYGSVKSFTTLSKQSQEITFSAIPEKTYGDDAFTLGNATTDQDLTVVYTADDNSIVSITGNQATILKAGTTTITATQAGNDEVEAATVDQTLVVNKKALTITANDQSKEYGATDPSNSVAYDGFIDGEDESDLSGALSYNRESGEDVDTYEITPGGLTSTNYAISFEVGELNIGQKALAVTAENQNKEYGSDDPTNSVTYDGFIDGEDESDLGGALSYSRESGEDVGTYEITPGGLTSTNYAISFEVGELSIDQKALTVTAENQNKTYGSADPSNSVVYDGFIDGEDESDLSGALSYNRESGEDVGTYEIAPSGLTSTNYTITFETGELSIGKKALAITAENQSKEYGSDDPTNSVAYDGFIDGEDESALSGELSYNRESGEDVGTYEITPSGLTSTNYGISFEVGELSIGQKALTITAENQSKAYGSDDPLNSVVYDGFIDGEDESVLSGALSFSREPGEDVGTYDITPSGLTSTNYSISFETGVLSIGQKVLTITAENKNKVYGSADPSNTVVYEGFVDGEDESDLSGVLSFSRESGEGVGTYEITPSGLTSSKYEISFAAGELSISQKQLTISNPKIELLKVYDGSRSASVEVGTPLNLESGDDVLVSGEALYDDENVGVDKTVTVSYSISGTDAENYLAPEDYSTGGGVIEQDFTPVFTSSNEFTINENEKAVTTLTATDENTDATLTYTLSGGSDQSLFEVGSSSGALSFTEAQDYEALQDADKNAVYEVEVTVSDGSNVASTLVKVTISDVNDNAPVIASSQSFLVDDRSQVGTKVGIINASDADSDAVLSGWTILSGNEDHAFSLDEETGELSVADESKLDKNIKSEYTLSVQVNDGLNTSVEESVLISLEDSEAPQAVLSVEIGTITNTAPIQVTAQFSEYITGFSLRDIRPNNARATNLQRVGPDLYTFDLLPFSDGLVEVILGRGSVRDASGNPSGQSNLLSFFYDATPPEPTFSSSVSSVSNESEVELTVSFSEIIQSISEESFTVINADIIDFSGDFGAYSITLAPLFDGAVEIRLEEGMVEDEAGNGNTAASFSWEADFVEPQVYSVEILTDALSNLNETAVSFRISDGEAGALFEYQFSSSNGTALVTGTGSMEEESTTVSGVDVSGLSDGEITLTVTLTDVAGNEGEPVSDKIIKDTEVNIPQGFSPNGDGIDDNWVIPGIEEFPENRVTIYNRYGKKVWSIEGYDNQARSWASSSNVSGVIGYDNLPDGTYFYILEFPNTDRKSESGYVIIKK